MKTVFTNPKIASFDIDTGKDWYVWFRIEGHPHPIKIYRGINIYPTFEQRMEEAQILREAVHLKLKSGWVPSNANNVLVKRGIIDAFKEAIDRLRPTLSKNTYDAYSGAVRQFIAAIKENRFDRMLADSFTPPHARTALETVRTSRSWTNANYNKNLGYLRSVYNEVTAMNQATFNPFNEIKNLKVIKKPANVPPTDEEMFLICDELKAKNPGFYIFYMLEYYMGIRPDELRNLKIKHLDFSQRYISLPAEITKTDRDRYVPMLGNTYELLSPYEGLNPEYYVFGTWVPNGGRHSQRYWFFPNPYPLKPDTPNKQWKKLIKDGLGIDKSLYSGKHKGADDKLAAGMDIKTISHIFGHSESKMTERYMHSLKLKQLEEARKVEMKVF